MNDFEISADPVSGAATAPRDQTAAAAARRAIGFGQTSAKPVRLHGVLRTGVERGSRVLLDENGTVLAQLMAGPDVLPADDSTVTVVGVFRRDLLTTAQQGAPFQVLHAAID